MQSILEVKGIVFISFIIISFYLLFNRHSLNSSLWLETYLSAHLRAILYADDPNYKLYGYRKFDPIPKPEDEERFLAACEELFSKGEFRK